MRPETCTRRMPSSHHGLGEAPELLEPVIHNNNSNKISITSNNNDDNNKTYKKTNNCNFTNSHYSSTRKTNSNNRCSSKNRNDNYSNSNTRQKNGTPSRLPFIDEGKSSSKRRSSSFSEVLTDLPTSQKQGSISTESLAMSTPRRASVPQGVTSHPAFSRRESKSSFAGVGRRVTSLIRFKEAFQARRQKTVPEDMPEENHMESILQMPESPRFSTFMSPEAQYATMKGYEDKLYEKIADINPEYRSCLQRNRTPRQRKISIVDQEQEDENKEETPDSKSPNSSLTTSGYGSLSSNLSTSSFSSSSCSEVIKRLDNRLLCPEPTINVASNLPPISNPCLKPLRRQSLATTTSADFNGNGMKMNSQVEGNMYRSNSLASLDPPGGLSHNKRLVLTYRLENAMDILDSIKKQNAETSLSPRVVRGLPWQVDAVKDFNSWTKVWNKEFTEAHK